MRLVSIALLTMALSVSLCPGAGADTPDNVRAAKRVFLESMAEGRFRTVPRLTTPSSRTARRASPGERPCRISR